MFATLRYDKDTVSLERANSQAAQGSPHYLACTNCRSKKVKCTGEKDGCQRCLSGKTRSKCIYPDASRANALKRRQVSVRKSRRSQDVDLTLDLSNSNHLVTSQDSSLPDAPPTIQALDAGPASTSLQVTYNSSATDTNDLHEPLERATDNARAPSFPWSPSLEQAREKSDNFDSNFFPDGRISVLDDDLDGFFGLGETRPFCNLPRLRTHSSCRTDYTLDSEASDFSHFSPHVSQSSSHAEGVSNSVCEHRHEDQAACAPSLDQRENQSKVDTGGQCSPKSPASLANSATMSCRCVDSALRLLEALEIKTNRVDSCSIDQVLCFGKRAMVECNRLLDCQPCVANSSFMMLLVVICQKLVSAIERLVYCISDEEQRLHERRKKTANPLNEESIASVGAFRMDTQEEWWGVFGTLTILQLRSLGILLDRLKVSAACWSWETHTAMLDLMESQIQIATSILLKAM